MNLLVRDGLKLLIGHLWQNEIYRKGTITDHFTSNNFIKFS